MIRLPAFGAVLWTLAATLAASPHELEVDASQPTIAPPWLTAALAPGAHGAVVSDDLGLLIFGCSDNSGGQIVAYQLGEDGALLDAPPQRLTLPKPARFSPNWIHYPLAMALHQRLPLLYVWQDVRHTTGEPPTADVVQAELDRLVVFELTSGQVTQRWAGVRGRGFRAAAGYGSIAVDPDNQRLYPNHMDNGDIAIGWLQLGSDGLPTLGEDGQVVAEVFPAREGVPGHHIESLLPVDHRTLLLSVHRRVVTWNIHDQAGEFVVMELTGVGQWSMMAGHPAKPMVYVSTRGWSDLHAVRHARGQLTMMPQRLTLRNGRFTSGPAVLVRRGEPDRLLIGGSGRVYAAELDDRGRFTGTIDQMELSHFHGRTLTSSARHGRAYVAVEALP
jgi:hypothetical protein